MAVIISRSNSKLISYLTELKQINDIVGDYNGVILHTRHGGDVRKHPRHCIAGEIYHVRHFILIHTCIIIILHKIVNVFF